MLAFTIDPIFFKHVKCYSKPNLHHQIAIYQVLYQIIEL
jgi:hypothetical protein